MKKSNFFPKIFPYVLSTFLLAGAYLINSNNEKPSMFITKQDQSINFNSALYTYFNLGLKRFISSTLWVSTILESDVDHYKKKDLNSWMFLRFNSISELEPKFYENYSFGGTYLSIIKDDIQGASILYQKGLNIYPNDYLLLKNAYFHFYFEAKDLKKSYDLLNRLQNFSGNNAYTKISLSRIEAMNGNLEKALFMLDEHQKRFPLETLIGKKIFEYRYSIKAEIDLACLNKGLSKCALQDLEGNPYTKSKNGYKAQKEWTPYRPKWKN